MKQTMKTMNTMTQHQRGYNLMEVLIGVLIFAVGMLALASLQGNLTRSASDANYRTVAINIAEEIIEGRRGFARIETDPLGVFPAYNDIVSGTASVERPVGSGIFYNVTATVTDYYYDLATDSFTTTAPPSIIVSDYKLLTLNVTWTAPEFRTTEGNVTVGRLGSGQVTLAETISSVTSAASSKVITQEDEPADPYSITYEPGQRPDIISLSLGNNKFKESLTPEPDVIRRDELVETRFDVITYSQSQDGTTFVRREEFATVSCECTLKAPTGNPDTSGRRPTIWAGDEYAEGHWVNKAWGESANNQQSFLCDTCCRDHHDGGSHGDDHADTAVNTYNPFRPAADYVVGGAFSGDHKHYSRDNQGNLVLAASANDTYLEVCRLVRVDGFFKVAQDFRQEDLHVFPEDFLDDPAEVDTYSAYVTSAADAYENASYPDYEVAPPCIGGPLPCVAEPTKQGAYDNALLPGEFPTWTTLPLGTSSEQQIRSRGIYIDYLSYDMRTVVDCLRAGGDEESCKTGDVELDRNPSINILEIVPFFDVQMTHLYRWNETPTNTPVDTTNEGLQDDNMHCRGVASRDDYGGSAVESKGHGGNIGFTDTQPNDTRYTSELRMAQINVQSLPPSGPPPPPPPGTDPVVSGSITETVNGLKATDIIVEGQNGALCDRTPGGFECTIPADAINPRVKILGYGKDGRDRWACLVGNPLDLSSEVINGQNAHAIFNLYKDLDPQPEGTGYDVNVQESACI